MNLKYYKFINLKNNNYLLIILLIIMILTIINPISALNNLNNNNTENITLYEQNNNLKSENLNLISDPMEYNKDIGFENNIISHNSVHDIPSNASNDDIQFIFDNSNSGDTILFSEMEYRNISIIVNKKLNIVSNSNSIIYTSSSINERASQNGITDSFGFYLSELAEGSLIKGLTFKVNSDYGIIVDGAGRISVKNNTISGGGKSGLFFKNSNICMIEKNDISKSYNGLTLDNVNRTKISGNSIYSNKNNGLILENVFLNNITKNNISKNKLDGVVLKDAKNNRILNNTITNNRNSGLRLEGNTTRNIIQYNNISGNVINIYANSLTNGDVIIQNTLMHAVKSMDSYASLDNTGAAIVFADNFSTSKYGHMLFERNSIGFNEQWDAKSTMEHPAVDIGANWYFDNDGEYGLGHICPMVFGRALNPEEFKHLSMGFGGDENGIFGQLYDGDTPSGAGSFNIDNVNINGRDYGSLSVGEDGRFYIDNLDEIPSGSIITITVGGHTFNVILEENTYSKNKDDYAKSNESSKIQSDNIQNEEIKQAENEGTSSNSIGNGNGSGTGNLRGSGSGDGNFTGSGIAVGDISGQSNGGTSDSGENGGGSASEGIAAYEIFKEENVPPTAKNSQLYAVAGVALVILIIALGYRSKNKDEFMDNDGTYEL